MDARNVATSRLISPWGSITKLDAPTRDRKALKAHASVPTVVMGPLLERWPISCFRVSSFCPSL